MTLLELTLETAINEAGEFKDVRLSREDVEYILTLLKEQDNCENCAIAVEDRQPIVRCKDCRYHNSEPDTHGDYCDKIHWSKGPNWFCGDGKRR